MVRPIASGILMVLAFACSNSKPGITGGLVVVIASDMSIPKDLDRIEVEVLENGRLLAQKTLSFLDDDVLPAEGARVTTSSGGRTIEIQARGYSANRVQVHRIAKVQIPANREAVLVLELEWLCSLPASAPEATTRCDGETTCISGQCVAPEIADERLPTIGEGGALAMFSPKCFDVVGCFKDSTEIQPQKREPGICEIPRPQVAYGLNLALRLPPESDGLCTATDCFVPLNGFALNSGWWEIDQTIGLPMSVCERVEKDPNVKLMVSTRCPSKTISIPACQHQNGKPDGGVPPETDGGALDSKPARLSIAPPRRDFGFLVAKTTSPPLSITVSNLGENPTGDLSVRLSGANVGDFHISTSSTCKGSLQANETCTVDIAFMPDRTGPRTALVTVEGSPGGTVSSQLLGTGINPSELVAAPTIVAFGNIHLNQKGAPRTVTLTNTGAVRSEMIEFQSEGLHPGDFTFDHGCTVLDPGQSCTAMIAFSPRARGDRSGTLRIVGNPGGTTLVNLFGSGLQEAAITVSAPTLSFGSIVNGTQSAELFVSLTNVGDATTGAVSAGISGQHVGDFAVLNASNCNRALSAGETCRIFVAFSPKNLGDRSALLTLSATPGGTVSTALSGTGIAPAQIGVSPSTLNFAARLVGTTGASQSVTITNNGRVKTGNIAITLQGSNPGDFQVLENCSELGPDENCTATVVFEPSVRGQRSATLRVSGNPGGDSIVNLTGLGQSRASLSISRTSLSFGPVIVGSTATLSTTITNLGDLPSGALSAAISGANLPAFSVLDNSTCNQILNSGTSCDLFIAFSPTTTDSHQASVTVVGNAGEQIEAQLSGAGIAPAQITVSPTSLDFGGRLIGTPSGSRTLTVTNEGSSPTGDIRVTEQDGQTGDFNITESCGVVVPGMSCTIVVIFTPSGRGLRQTTLNISSNPGGSTAVPLSGIGLNNANLFPSATAVAFGSIVTGLDSSEEVVTVTNQGDVSAGALMMVVTGANPSDFVLQGNSNCSGNLAPNASCNAFVRFSPSAPGNRAALLTISGMPGGDANVQLNGAGISPAQIVVSTASANFSDRLVDTTSTSQRITVTNTGGVAASIPTLSFVGSHPSDFTQQNSCNTTLSANGGSCNIDISFSPTSTGARSATLSISSSGTKIDIALSGTGTSSAVLYPPFSTGLGSVTLHPNGSTLFFADWADGNVYKGDTTGGPVTLLAATGVPNLRGLCLSTAQNPTYLYAMGLVSHQLIRIVIASGNVDQVFGSYTIGGPHGCAVSPDGGTLYVGSIDSQTVFAMPAPGGLPVPLVSPFGSPVQVVLSADGSTIFSSTDGGYIYRFSAGGTNQTPVPINTDSVYKSTAMAISPNEQKLYLADDAEIGTGGGIAARIFSMPSGGGGLSLLFTSTGSTLRAPVFFAIDPWGRQLLVSDQGQFGTGGIHAVSIPPAHR